MYSKISDNNRNNIIYKYFIFNHYQDNLNIYVYNLRFLICGLVEPGHGIYFCNSSSF